MDKLNQVVCFIGRGNSGRTTCDIEPGIEKGGLLVPANFKFNAADMDDDDTLFAAIQAAMEADDPAERIYMIGPYEDISPNGESAVTETSGYGNKRTVRRGTISNDFTIWGGKGLHASLFPFSGQHSAFNYIEIDSLNTFWGRAARDTNNARVLGGYRLSNLYIGDYVKPTGAAGGKFTITIGYEDAAEANTEFAYYRASRSPLSELNGLISVMLQGVSNATNTLSVTAKTIYGADLRATLETELEDQDAWEATNADTTSVHYGNVVSIPTVVSNATGWTITLAPPTGTGADADNPGPGKKIALRIVKPSALAALTTPITGIESDTILITLHA